MTESSRSRVTRQDRAIRDDAWIADFLRQAPVATLATVQGNQPFQSMLLFALDETGAEGAAPASHVIYFHTARRGRIWENLQAAPQVCLSAFEMGRLLPADTALNFSVEYHSAVAFGPAYLVTDPGEAERALQLILDKYFPHLHPGPDYRPITDNERDITAVYRLEVEEWSGKRKAVAEDFPGAFTYPWKETD